MNKYISDDNKFVADIAKEITVAAIANDKITVDNKDVKKVIDFYEKIFNGISEVISDISMDEEEAKLIARTTA